MSEVWLHIDHIDNKGGEVWAVQIPDKRRYITCHKVNVEARMNTIFRKSRQPRAYLRMFGKVKVARKNGKVIVTIRG